jgi:hypothetical protein
MNQETARKFSFKKLIKRFGIAGFLFFFIKGLLWLIVPFLIGYSLW